MKEFKGVFKNNIEANNVVFEAINELFGGEAVAKPIGNGKFEVYKAEVLIASFYINEEKE